MNKKEGGIAPDTIVAIAATVIALSALFVSVYQGMEIRKHNRVSVRPAISFSEINHRSADKLGIFIENNGLGPGIITKFDAVIGDERISVQDAKGWRSALNELNLNQPWVSWRYLGEGYVLKPGERIFLLIIDKNLDIDQKQRFFEAIGVMQLDIDYESMYGEKRNVKRFIEIRD